MEHESIEREERAHAATTAGVARSQNVLYVLPHDAAAAAQFLGPAFERVEPGAAETQLLVLTPDPDTAVSVAEAATRTRAGALARVLPVTNVRRAERLLRARPATVIIGTPADVLELIRAAALKLDALRSVMITWADELTDGSSDALESVMVEVPKDAARVIVVSHVTSAVEALVERYARRARRTGIVPAAEPEAIDLRYLSVAPQSRATALRRLLDDIDPDRAAVYARSDEAAEEIAATSRALGYVDASAIVVTRGEAVPGASLVILYETPLSRDVLRSVMGESTMLIAMVTPRQLPALRALTTGRMTPYTLSGPAARAQRREERMRDELRLALGEGIPARELLALEPLLLEFDGVELAAAALRLLERERERVRLLAAERSTEAAAARPPMTRLFVSAGTRDGVGPRDLVGAITHVAGITGDQVGRIDLRENHALVEVASEHAEQVATKLTGTMLRGRRLTARVDTDRGARPRDERDSRSRGERPGRPRGDRPYPRGDRPGARGDRPGARGDRSGPRGDRPGPRGRPPRRREG